MIKKQKIKRISKVSILKNGKNLKRIMEKCDINYKRLVARYQRVSSLMNEYLFSLYVLYLTNETFNIFIIDLIRLNK